MVRPLIHKIVTSHYEHGIEDDNITERFKNTTNDAFTQFTGYLSEPQLRFDLNPLEWWRTREEKYPAIATIAKKYLAIPSTSAIQRCFSTAGNIVTPKRSCLLPENVDMLVFLYQNRKLYF
ncbi:unnamed protein product [Macrosiphum euphorbiae]|uniref:HAT C-terminal dimerisation domain-containing protein n=1 Tax=Macrosiphum euphorbiae TaxID=13131 RepID=A0AAV0XSA9_9HEMI|nr:unnamed protein product [Macrosiphum euphorbiae]